MKCAAALWAFLALSAVCMAAADMQLVTEVAALRQELDELKAQLKVRAWGQGLAHTHLSRLLQVQEASLCEGQCHACKAALHACSHPHLP